MRVLMIAQSSYSYDARIIRLSSALIEKNIDVDLICLRYKDQPKYEVLNGVNIHRIIKNFHQDSIFSYIFFSIVFVFRALFKSISLSSKNKHDLVHVHNMPDYLVFSAAYHKLKGIPVILDIHDITVELFKEKWSRKKFAYFESVLKFSERLSCNFADHVLTVTKECVDILVNRDIKSEKITLIMNSADENVFTNDTSRFKRHHNKGFKLLYHGTIAKRFGIHYFIKAMPEILKIVPDAEYHLYGSFNNEYSNELNKMIIELGLAGNIIFSNPIPYAELNEMIKDYDLGVVTYEQTEYMNLAMPTKAGEYALSGLPFIISELNSLRSIFREESVCYVNPEDSGMIANEVIKLFRNPSKRSDMATKAYEDMLNISWDVVREKYLSLIKKLAI